MSTTIAVHNLKLPIANESTEVYCQVTQFKDSLILWLGLSGQEANLGHLAVALKADLATPVLGSPVDCEADQLLASKLSRKLNKPVFVSVHLPTADPLLYPEIEKKLFAEIKNNP